MSKVDLHVHSKYSDHPSEWFLKRIGANESYTEPEYIYNTAKENGMDFITLTDHNSIEGALRLKEKYPQDVFTGVEATTYFPESGCKIHALIYGLSEAEFAEIQIIRNDIYHLRDYIKNRQLAYSIAHAMYAVNDRLDIEHLEKLLLLFDNFEGINGARNKMNNNVLIKALQSLTPDKIETLYKKHHIEPISAQPWVKCFTGGSDDHSGIFIGKTYTVTNAADTKQFIKNITGKKVSPDGRHNDFKSLAFAIYKIAYDYSMVKSNDFSKTFISKLSGLLFGRDTMNMKDKLKIKKMKYSYKKGNDAIRDLITELIDELRSKKLSSVEGKLDVTYQKVAAIADEFAKLFFKSIEKGLQNGDIVNIVKNVSLSLPGLLLLLPFFSTFKHLFQSRVLADKLTALLNSGSGIKTPKKILWFLDLENYNEQSLIRPLDIASILKYTNTNIYIAACFEKGIDKNKIPENILKMPSIYSFSVPWDKNSSYKIPSILNSLKQVYEYEPDEICVSSAGPAGLFGLLAAKLLNIKCTVVYDSNPLVNEFYIKEDDSLFGMCEVYQKWFYSNMDDIILLKNPDIAIFRDLEIDPNKIQLIKSTVKASLYSSKKPYSARHNTQECYDLEVLLKELFEDKPASERYTQSLLKDALYKQAVFAK